LWREYRYADGGRQPRVRRRTAAHPGLYGRLERRSVSFSVPPGDSRAAKDIAERPSNSPPLELPPLEEVERSLDLDSEDRGTIPGLYNLNVEGVPVRRLVGMQVLIAFCFSHNNLVFGDLMLPRVIWVGSLLEASAVTQIVVLRRWFIRFEQFHLGTFFLVANIAVLTSLGRFALSRASSSSRRAGSTFASDFEPKLLRVLHAAREVLDVNTDGEERGD
jgi:hypothetical protein